MATQTKKIVCQSCGFANTPPLANNRCVSCGAKVEDIKRVLTRQEELDRRYQQESFSVTWFVVSIAIMVVTTAAFVMGLPMVVPAFDFEGSGVPGLPDTRHAPSGRRRGRPRGPE